MFFTRSIRRKMVSGMVLVLVMLLILSVSGMWGLRSYRNVINDLDFSVNQAPRRADLVAAIGLLFEPLLMNPQPGPEGARFQQAEFQKRLTLARERIADFHRKLSRMPRSPGMMARTPITEALLADVDRRLDRLEELQASLADEQLRVGTGLIMLQEAAHLQTLAQQVPDPQEGLHGTLRQARSVYQSTFTAICSTAVLVVLLFFGLVWSGYQWIFAPIRKLYQGASRVAQGDFNYRVHLASNDEMAELADSFNKMTDRFQEITAELDQQVRERSKQLVRSERLAGVGFLAAGVAHEINNPLSAIAMAAESLEGRTMELLSEGDPTEVKVVGQYLGMIQRESFRCQQITRKLLDFARGQDATRSRNDLTALIGEVLSMVRHLGKFRDREITFSRTDPCFVEVNGPEIKQVVLNLVANSLESMADGGELRIEIIERTDHVQMVFADDGCGMTEDVLENLFEPFFTQRPAGKGTGLGLSISQRIVGDHGGTIEAESAGPRQGSIFRVHLPRKAVTSEAA